MQHDRRTNCYGSSSAGGLSRIPPVDVDDALQYTPLSSIVPFSSDIIPIPSVTTTRITSSFFTEIERQSSRQTLEMLNRESQTDPQSRFVRKYLHEISSHLGGDGHTEFRFKGTGGLGGGGADGDPGPSDMLKNSKIGKFGEIIMNKSNVSFKYPTSSAPAAGFTAPPPPPPPLPPPALYPPTAPVYHTLPSIALPPQNSQYGYSLNNHDSITVVPPQNQRSTAPSTPANGYNYQQQPIYVQTPQQSNIFVQIPQRSQQQRTNGNHVQSPTPPGGSQRAEAVIIATPSTLNRAQYTKHRDIDQSMRKSKPMGTTVTSKNRKRKRSHSDAEDDETLATGVDQRAKAESLLKALQGLIDSIFEAEDNIQPDTSGRIVERNSKMWMASSLDSENPCLATAVQMKLEATIKRVVSARRFDRIPVDDLTRLQKICESTLKMAESINTMVGTDDGELATEEWMGRVAVVDNALKTARTVLRIMCGGREEKQVYSEDLLSSVLNVVKNLVEGTMNPMIEMRSTGETLEIFKAAVAHKKILQGLLHEVTSVFSLLSQLIASEEVTEGAITTMEFIAVAVIFLENAASDKDSVFGVQKVERFRVAAMDVLTKIFARYPDQRTFIFDEILTSLEKLPVTRQSARQFKLVEGGKNIQLVSALIMRLVQTSGTYQGRKKKRGLVAGEDGEVVLENEDSEVVASQEDRVDDAETDPGGIVGKLYLMCEPLRDSAQKNASYVINFLVGRAMKSTKTGDAPYRVLMDIFTEDFIAVLGSPEWPGAELLLRSILHSMCTIVDGDKQPAPAKSMALDLLGLMGSAICDMNVHLREIHRNRDGSGESADAHIAGLTERYLEGAAAGGDDIEGELIDWDGPFRYALEHLLEMNTQDGSLQSACGYYLTAWSARICSHYEKITEEDDADEDIVLLASIAKSLRRITIDKNWIDDDFDVNHISSAQVKQAYVLTIMHMPFCTSFEHILNRLLRSMDDNQATTRSKGLKAIMQLLQTDPNILNRQQVIPYIMKRSRDPSPLVRDSALDLIGKIILLRPDLEETVYKIILERAADAGVGVRKRAMKISKDIYLRSRKEVVKVAIAEALVQRIKDSDTGVSELARKTFEEIWITPFYGLIREGEEEVGEVEISPKMKLIVNERVAVIVKVVQKEAMLAVLHDVIKSLLHPETKNCYMNFRVCKTMVGSMCDDLLDRQSDSDKAERQNTLQTLTVFARANPKLFTAEQLTMFQPYIENLTADDLHVFRSVIVIYRCALPVMSSLQSGFLANVQQSLLKNLSRLPAPELKEVVACLWTINGVLKNPERLIRVTISCLTNILKSKGKAITSEAESKRLVRTLHILGLFGKNCDFENQAQIFQIAFPQWKGTSVSGLITDTIIPFVGDKIEISVRKAALESLGYVCQTHASHFLKPLVLSAYDKVFEDGDKDLMNLVLLGVKGFLKDEEIRSELIEAAEEGGNAPPQEHEGRLAQLANQNQNDGVSTSLSQKYLKNIITIALGSQDGYALTATEVIGSILRQGLVHPKECVPALVALETSTNPTIQGIAFREHRTLHSKHETIVERGYMDGVRTCFLYQRKVIGDGSGATTQPYISKMRPLYDIVKGSRKVRKKFLSNLTLSVDFDPSKLDLAADPNHLEYSKFIVENLAYFEYGTLDEVYQVVTSMERVVAGTGMTVAHSIETEIFFIKIDAEGEVPSEKVIDPTRLKILSAAAAILSMLWESRTYLRKLYNLNEAKSRDYKANKLSAKDVNKAPTRSSGVSGASLWDEITRKIANLQTQEGAYQQCREFVEMLSVDNEFKLAAEGEEDLEAAGGGNRAVTPESDGEGKITNSAGMVGAEPSTPSKARKRKLMTATPESRAARVRKKGKIKPKKTKDE